MDRCEDCGRVKTELTAEGTIRYCWWCEDRAAAKHPPHRAPPIFETG